MRRAQQRPALLPQHRLKQPRRAADCAGLLEFFSAIAIDQMLRGSGREPGDYGFDPLGMISDPEKKEMMQMKELANGRLAMFAFGGAVTQAVLTGNTFPWLYTDGASLL